MEKNTTVRTSIVLVLMLVAAFSRIIPHPANFAPIAALGLFGSAYLTRKWLAITTPLLSTLISDVVLNNTVYAQYFDGFTLVHSGWYWVYGSIILITVLGYFTLKTVNVKTVLSSSILASVLFFLITNFGTFVGNPMYSQNAGGLMACYAAGIPFFGGTLFGTLFYSGILFGGFELAKKQFPALRLA